MRWKYMSRAKSYPPGRSGWSGGDNCALNSTKLPTAGVLPLRTATRTRSGDALATPAVSKGCMRTTMRSLRSRSSRTSTKPGERGRNRALQDPMSDATRLQGGRRQPEGHCGQRERNRERNRAPARQKSADRRYQSQSESSPSGRLPVGGEVETTIPKPKATTASGVRALPPPWPSSRSSHVAGRWRR